MEGGIDVNGWVDGERKEEGERGREYGRKGEGRREE